MKRSKQSGFTLIELTLVLAVSALVASALIGLFRAHTQMLNQALKYKFLAQDAPFIGLLMTRTIGNAEDYRIYASGAIARSTTGTPAVGLTGSAVKLWMRQPNSTFRLVVVSFETNVTTGQGIYVYLTDLSTGVFSTTPNWEMAGASSYSLSAVNFAIDSTTLSPTDTHPGVLLVTLTGSYNDWYRFAAEKK
jgi:prepilin-type N-terminal cleavage/methylation domain-containing protein